MKKLICAFLLLGLLLPCCAALADGGALVRGSVAYVNNTNPTDRLNLRTKPSVQSVSLGKYYNGTWVTVLDVSGGWAHVRIDPLEGYMDAAYLTADASQVNGHLPTVFVHNDERRGAALHSQPSESSTVLTTYPYGSAVYNVLSVRDDGWRHVYDSDLGYGFVFADVLTPKLSYHKDSGLDYAYVCNPDPTDRLHLRAAPNAGADSLGKYYNGVQVLVLDDAGGGYLHVLVSSLEGYMRADYLSTQPVASAQPVVTVSNPRGTGANVRNAPSLSATYPWVAHNGETLTVLAVREDGWLHVLYQGEYGFVRGELVMPTLSWEKR